MRLRQISVHTPPVLVGTLALDEFPPRCTADGASAGSPPLRARDFFNFHVLNGAAATFVMGVSYGGVVATLAPHLERRLRLRDSARVGLVYLLFALVYSLSCPVFGRISDRRAAASAARPAWWHCPRLGAAPARPYAR